MITKVDWKSAGFATGSKTVELDWKDWNSPVISRLIAKLLRKRTYHIGIKNYFFVLDRCKTHQVRNCGVKEDKKGIFLS